MPTRTLILGCGSQAKVAWSILSLMPEVDIAGFVDVCDNPEVWGRELLGLEILGGMSLLPELAAGGVEAGVPAFGDNVVREQVAARAAEAGLRLLNAVHPAAVVSAHALIGNGVTIGPGAVINIAARVGNCAIINSAAVVEHDCVIGDCAHVAPGAKLAGNVTVGHHTLIGIGATVIQGINIGANAVVGAGAVVIRDVPDGATVVGVPARPIAERRVEKNRLL